MEPTQKVEPIQKFARFTEPISCSNCVYFREDPELSDVGECRVTAPVVFPEFRLARFPVVTSDSWCGNHVYGQAVGE